MNWDWLDAVNWNAVMGIATAATCLVAILALRSAARDSHERSRPDIVVEYRVEPRAHSRLTFVVRNAGPTTARDIRLRFTPDLEPALATQVMRPFVADRYRDPIPMLSPGQELTNVVIYDADDLDTSDLPEDLRVDVEYHGLQRRPYLSTYRLNAAVYKNHTYSTRSDSVEGRLKTIAADSKATAKATERIARALEHLAPELEPDPVMNARNRRLLQDAIGMPAELSAGGETTAPEAAEPA